MKISPFFLKPNTFTGIVALASLIIAPSIALAGDRVNSEACNPSGTMQSTTPPSSMSDPSEVSPELVVNPVDGRVNMELINKTNATIRYQIIGDTQVRQLMGSETVDLTDVDAPVTLVFYREDKGLLVANAKASSTTGVLEVTFDETLNRQAYNLALTVEEAGSVYIR